LYNIVQPTGYIHTRYRERDVLAQVRLRQFYPIAFTDPTGHYRIQEDSYYQGTTYGNGKTNIANPSLQTYILTGNWSDKEKEIAASTVQMLSNELAYVINRGYDE